MSGGKISGGKYTIDLNPDGNNTFIVSGNPVFEGSDMQISNVRMSNNPIEIKGNEQGFVSAIRCIRMELGEPDASGRRSPVEVPGSEYDIPVDCVIMAIGTSPNPLIKSTTEGLEISKRGGIVVNEKGLTSREGIYAGGDAVTGAATVILAMGAGKTAASAIDEYIKEKNK